MIDEINRTRADHILTIEDPIEFVHRHKRCIVNQREIGADATSFADALRAALRQDPDVILVGEMRDLETIATALTAAETGHLVFGTLHTQSAPSTVDRIIDVFPAEQQEQVRMQLAGSLQGDRHAGAAADRRRHRPRRRARDPPPRRRDPEPDPPGEGRADLLDHADRAPARDADDGAVARRARRAPRRSRSRRRSRARAAPDQLIGAARARELRHDSRRRGGAAAAAAQPLAAALRVADGQALVDWKKEVDPPTSRRKPDERPLADAPAEPARQLDLEEGALAAAKREAASDAARAPITAEPKAPAARRARRSTRRSTAPAPPDER